MRPFWIHQFAEYLIGIALVSQGLQDTEPLVPDPGRGGRGRERRHRHAARSERSG